MNRRTLKDNLLNLHGDALACLTKQIVPLAQRSGTTKSDRARTLERHLCRDWRGFVAGLGDAERAFLACSVHQERVPKNSVFAALTGLAAPSLRSDGYGARTTISKLNAVIVWPDYRERDSMTVHVVAEAVEPLRQILPPPARPVAKVTEEAQWARETTVDGAPCRRFETAEVAPREMVRVLRLIQGGKIKVTPSSRRPTESSVRLLAAALLVPDFALETEVTHFLRWEKQPPGAVRAHAWAVIAQQAGWAKIRSGALELTARGKALAMQFDPTALRDAVSCIASDDTFDELNRIPAILGQGGKQASRFLSAVSGRKAALLKAMAESFPTGEWISFDEAFRLTLCTGGYEIVKGGVYDVLYLGDKQYGMIQDDIGLQRQFARAFMMETLATLGIIDVIYCAPHGCWPELGDEAGAERNTYLSRYDGLLQVRLNPAGAYALGRIETFAAPAPAAPSLQVLSNLEIVRGDSSGGPGDDAMLEQMAVCVGENHWRLDAAALLHSIESGARAVEMREWLEKASGQALPFAAAQFIEDVASKAAACMKATEGIIFEWRDEDHAQYIASSTSGKRSCLYLGGNRLLVLKSHMAEFRRTVRALGHLLPEP